MIERLGTESQTVNMFLPGVIGFRFSPWKGISVGKQLDVQRKESWECSVLRITRGYALDF